MRTWILGFAAFSGLCLASVPARAQTDDRLTGYVAVGSGYHFLELFNERFSSEPFVEAYASKPLGGGAYVSAYVSTGLSSPLGDEPSNYGFEAGKTWRLSPRAEVTVAVGRFANYYGEGFGRGDWYARADLRAGPTTLSVGAFVGATDSVIVGAAHDIAVGDRLTVTPSVAFVTATGDLNPSVSASYRLTDDLALGASVVGVNEEGERGVFGAVTLTWSF